MDSKGGEVGKSWQVQETGDVEWTEPIMGGEEWHFSGGGSPRLSPNSAEAVGRRHLKPPHLRHLYLQHFSDHLLIWCRRSLCTQSGFYLSWHICEKIGCFLLLSHLSRPLCPSVRPLHCGYVTATGTSPPPCPAVLLDSSHYRGSGQRFRKKYTCSAVPRIPSCSPSCRPPDSVQAQPLSSGSMGFFVAFSHTEHLLKDARK